MLTLALPFAAALSVTLLLTPVVRLVARRLGMVAAPSPDRWHERPTALLGGVGIYVGFLAGALAALLVRAQTGSPGVVPVATGMPFGVGRPWVGVFVAASLMFAVGLIDDRLRLNPATKLTAQAVAAGIVVSFGVVFPLSPWMVLNVLLTFFWFLALTNALNLLDHMDGVAAGVTGIAALFLAATLYLDGAYVVAAAALALAGAAFGFLPFNFPRASVFMGDAGSMFLGAMLAGLGAAYPSRISSASVIAVLFVPAMIVIIPIVDTLLVTTTRTLAGRPVSVGGRDHTSHRLIAMGLTERQVALVLYGIAGAGGLIALVLRTQPASVGIAVGGVFLSALLILVAYLARFQPYTPAAAPPGRVTLMVTDLVHKRRALEVVMDLVLFAVAYQVAYLLRWDGRPPAEQEAIFVTTLAVVVAVQSASFAVSGVYRGNWHHLALSDALRIVRATLLAALLTTAALVFFFRDLHFARGILVIDAVLVGVLAIGARASFRSLELFRHNLRRSAVPALVYGAGGGGILAVREMVANGAVGMMPVAFVDDDPMKQGTKVHGIPVIPFSRARAFAQRRGVGSVVIACRDLAPARAAELRSLCDDLGVVLSRFCIHFEEVREQPGVAPEVVPGRREPARAVDAAIA